MAVEFKVTLDNSLIKKLEELDSLFRNSSLKRLLDNIGTELRESTVERISETKIGPDGQRWEELLQPRADGSSNILEDTGALKSSIRYEIEGNTDLLVGSDLEYAATHQFGDPERNIVDRPFLGISKEDEKIIEKIIERHFKEAT